MHVELEIYTGTGLLHWHVVAQPEGLRLRLLATSSNQTPGARYIYIY